jgi:hypothetical protein
MGGSWGVASRFLAGVVVLSERHAPWARCPGSGAEWNLQRSGPGRTGIGPDAPPSAHPHPLWVGRTLTPLRPRGLGAAVAAVGGWPLAVPQASKMSIGTGRRESVSRFGSDSGTNLDRDTTPRHPLRYSSRKTSRKWISFREIASITRYGSLPPFPPNTWRCSGLAAGMSRDGPPSAHPHPLWVGRTLTPLRPTPTPCGLVGRLPPFGLAGWGRLWRGLTIGRSQGGSFQQGRCKYAWERGRPVWIASRAGSPGEADRCERCEWFRKRALRYLREASR